MTLTREQWARQLVSAPILAVDGIEQLREQLELVKLALEITINQDGEASEQALVRIVLLLENFLSYADEPLNDVRGCLLKIRDSRPVGWGWEDVVNKLSDDLDAA